MKLFDLLTDFHNWLSDKDFIWWPFSFLRPKPQELITFKLTLIMTACFGGLTLIFFTVFALVNNALTLNGFLTTMITCSLAFFTWFNAITRPLWNRRAHKLQNATK
jgi:hypothetical protein